MDLPEKLKGKNTPVEKIVLLLAALEKNGSIPSADYKLMSALSGGQYTPSALEHQFRDLRKAASDLLKKNPDITGKDAVTSSPKKRKEKSMQNEGNVEGEEGRAPKSPRKNKKEPKIKSEPKVIDDGGLE